MDRVMDTHETAGPDSTPSKTTTAIRFRRPKTLGLSRQGLIKKMKRLGIDAAEMSGKPEIRG